MTWGARKAERVRFERRRYPVNLIGVDGTWRRSCVLVDVSATGARLQVDGSLDVLKDQQFLLILTSTGLAFRRCELVRIDGADVGVRFVAAKGTQKTPRYPTKTNCPAIRTPPGTW